LPRIVLLRRRKAGGRKRTKAGGKGVNLKDERSSKSVVTTVDSRLNERSRVWGKKRKEIRENGKKCGEMKI